MELSKITILLDGPPKAHERIAGWCVFEGTINRDTAERRWFITNDGCYAGFAGTKSLNEAVQMVVGAIIERAHRIADTEKINALNAAFEQIRKLVLK